jgi:hypothetical protein
MYMPASDKDTYVLGELHGFRRQDGGRGEEPALPGEDENRRDAGQETWLAP